MITGQEINQRPVANVLVLTRKSEQKIIIGRDKKITITILKVQGDQVSVGIQADGEIPIYREELLQEKEPEARTPARNPLKNLSLNPAWRP
jgi:carbon storage regulator